MVIHSEDGFRRLGRWGCNTHRFGDTCVKSSAVSALLLIGVYHRNFVPAAGCAGERNEKTVTIGTFDSDKPL